MEKMGLLNPLWLLVDGTLDIGKVTTGNKGVRLVVDINFEHDGTPVDRLDRAF